MLSVQLGSCALFSNDFPSVQVDLVRTEGTDPTRVALYNMEGYFSATITSRSKESLSISGDYLSEMFDEGVIRFESTGCSFAIEGEEIVQRSVMTSYSNYSLYLCTWEYQAKNDSMIIEYVLPNIREEDELFLFVRRGTP